ncbi:MAG: hypothetical protein AAF403_02750, partial [Pseudomonadota bacterium]
FLLSNRHLPGPILSKFEKLGVTIPESTPYWLPPVEDLTHQAIFSEEENARWQEILRSAPVILSRPKEHQLSRFDLAEKTQEITITKPKIAKIQPRPLPSLQQLAYQQDILKPPSAVSPKKTILESKPAIAKPSPPIDLKIAKLEETHDQSSEQVEIDLQKPIDVLPSMLNEAVELKGNQPSLQDLVPRELSKPDFSEDRFALNQDQNSEVSSEIRQLQKRIANLKSSNVFVQSSQTPIHEWQIETGLAGVVAQALIANRPEAKLAKTTLNNRDYLFVSGWAGHMRLGMRMQGVLFSLCDRIIGLAYPQNPSLEIAQQINSHLSEAAFEAIFPVALLPRCSNALLRAYGISAYAKIIWPLAGALKLNLTGQTKVEESALAAIENPIGIRIPFPNKLLKIADEKVTLRSCPAAHCSEVASLGTGQMEILIFEEFDDWLLLQADDVGGWIAKSFVTISDIES